jgi:hypothetical protein
MFTGKSTSTVAQPQPRAVEKMLTRSVVTRKTWMPHCETGAIIDAHASVFSHVLHEKKDMGGVGQVR